MDFLIENTIREVLMLVKLTEIKRI